MNEKVRRPDGDKSHEHGDDLPFGVNRVHVEPAGVSEAFCWFLTSIPTPSNAPISQSPASDFDESWTVSGNAFSMFGN